MNFLGVPILDWILLLVLLGFGVEAYLTTRPDASASSAVEHDCDESTPQQAAKDDPPAP